MTKKSERIEIRVSYTWNDQLNEQKQIRKGKESFDKWSN